MPVQTVIASAVGLVAGLAIALAATGGIPDDLTGELVVQITARLAPITCALLILTRYIRRWLTAFTADTRQELQAAAEQRHLFTAEVNRRLAEVARREAAANRSFAAGQAQIAAANKAHAEEHAAYLALQAEHEELLADYNRVVQQSLQQTADLFRPRMRTTVDGPTRRLPLPTRAAISGDLPPYKAHDVAADPYS